MPAEHQNAHSEMVVGSAERSGRVIHIEPGEYVGSREAAQTRVGPPLRSSSKG